MSQIALALGRAHRSNWLFRWKATIIAAFAGGSLTAALFNIGAAMALALVRSAMAHCAPARRRGQ